jgi:hypothetical protein
MLITRPYTLLEILGSMTNSHARTNMRSMIGGVHLACEHKDQLFGLLMVIHLMMESEMESDIEVIVNLGTPGRLGSL